MAQASQQQICELHFYEDDFETMGTLYEQQLSTTVTIPLLSQNKLKKDAVPRIFPGDPEYLSKANSVNLDEKKYQEEKEQLKIELEKSWKSQQLKNSCKPQQLENSCKPQQLENSCKPQQLENSWKPQELENSWKPQQLEDTWNLQQQNPIIHIEEVQVIQPISAPQVQHLYLPQQHVVYSGHLSGSTTLQNVGSVPGVSLQIQPKGPFDSKPYGVQNVQPLQRTFVLQHHKQPHYSSVPVHSNVQILNGNNLAQVPQRQVISAQAPGHMYGSPQVLGSYALSPLPPGYSWASTSYAPQSPFIIRTPQPNIYVQHPSPHMAMHMAMPMHAAPTAVATQNYSEICQETQTISSETVIPSVSQSTPCSSISSIVSSNTITSSMPSAPQSSLYSLLSNHNHSLQYSQSLVSNQDNQSMEIAAQNQTNQAIETVVHNSANEPIDSVTQTSAIQVLDPGTLNPMIQSAESVDHNKMNTSSESLNPGQSNQYLETSNPNAAVQYMERPVYNQTHQSTESIISNQGEQYLESPNHSLSNKFTESQATQCSQIESKPSLNVQTGFDGEEESVEMFKSNEGFSKEYKADLLPQIAQRMQEHTVREPLTSANVSNSNSVAVSTVTSSPSSMTALKDQPPKSPLKTYSYTVVSPSSTTQCDNTDEGNGQNSGNGFYPIIKLKRLKPQDPLGKPDSVDKHLQKAIVKPQMLAPVPDNFQTTERPGSFPEPLKPSPSSPESLPLKKRKVFPIESDNVPSNISTKYPEPIPPITDILGQAPKRGRGRPRGRKSSSSRTPVKSKSPAMPKSPATPKSPAMQKSPAIPKSPALPKSPVSFKTPSPKITMPPVTPNKEAIHEQLEQQHSPLETRRSKRKKAKIEVIEIVDDHDPVKIEVESPMKSMEVDSPTKTSYSLSNLPKARNVSKGTVTSESSCEDVKSSGFIDNAFNEINPCDGNLYDSHSLILPSTSKASSFDSENYDLKAISAMSVQEICDYVNGFTGCLDYGDVFKSQEIDGQALLLLNLDHLMTGFSMRLGPAVKLISHITSLKMEEESE